jgi:hypothetical protein
MDNNTLVGVSIALTAVAILIQAGVLVGLYVAVRKTSERVESIVAEVKTKVLPTAEVAHSMLLELRPRIETVAANVSDSTVLARAQLQRIDATVTDVIDRTRLQVIRADALISRTMDRVEETSDVVHKTVISPVRRISGIVQGVTAGVDFFIGGKRRARTGAGGSQDEMFI